MSHVTFLQRTFHETFSTLDQFSPKTDLITSDLQVVKKRSFFTWLGRIFTPQKYRAENVVHSLHKYIQVHGRKGEAAIMVDSDGELKKESKQVSFKNSAGLGRFLAVLSNTSRQFTHYSKSSKPHPILANKLEKLLHAKSDYLDASIKNRSNLSRLEQLKGRIIEIDLSKPSQYEDSSSYIERALDHLSDQNLTHVDLDQEAIKIQRSISILQSLKKDSALSYNPTQTHLESAYVRLRDRFNMNRLPVFEDFMAGLTKGLKSYVNSEYKH